MANRPVPANDTVVSKMYINTKLTTQEVVNILSKINDLKTYGFYIAFCYSDGEAKIETDAVNMLEFEYAENVYTISKYDRDLSPQLTTLFDSNDGWKISDQLLYENKLSNAYYAEIVPVGYNNSLISGLFSIDPFTDESSNCVSKIQLANGEQYSIKDALFRHQFNVLLGIEPPDERDR